MQVCVTALVRNIEPCECSASAAELGQDAGRITWNNSVEAGKLWGVLDTPEKLEAMREHLRGFGAWEDEEIAGWDAEKLNGFLAQSVAGWMREGGLPPSPSDADWQEYETRADQGTAPAYLYRGGDGEAYVYLER